MINETLLEKACKAIDKSEKSFGIGESFVFYVVEADQWEYQAGSMPSYFDHNGKRYVLYKKPNKL